MTGGLSNTPTGKSPDDWHRVVGHNLTTLEEAKAYLNKAKQAYLKVQPWHRAIKEKLMLERVNEAIDKGWRLREAGPPGCWALVPPEMPDRGFTVQGVNTFQLMVPIVEIETWLKARVVISPDEKKRHELKAKVVNWMSAEWNSYVKECEGDKEYAAEIIVQDASSDFDALIDDVKEWFDARNN